MIEQIETDYKAALKNKETLKVTVLRTIKANIKLKEIDKKDKLTEEELVMVVSKEIKQRKDSIEEFTKANRMDLVEKEEAELNILTAYMPTQLTSEELDKIIDEVFGKVNPTSSKEIGMIMKEITPLVKGKTDMKELMNIIKNRLDN